MTSEGKTPVYSSDSSNNGIIGYTTEAPEFIVNKENSYYVVFGDHTRTFNIATNSFCVADNVKVLRLNKFVSIKSLLFILSSWRKCIPNKGYSRHWSVARDVSFNLPTKNGQIDFDFMERFVAELEAESIEKLNDYLTVTNLNDYQLTQEEQKVLEKLQVWEFTQFRVIDIFRVKNAGNILSRDIIEDSGDTPYLCASRENNSVSSYISYDEKYLDHGNCVFIGGKTFVVTYQESDFYSNDSHNLVLYLKNEKERNKLNQLFLATCVEKSLGHKYSWGDSISNRKIQKDVVSLPVIGDKIDFSSMSILISAVQKLIIRDVVEYTENKITEHEKVLQKA